MQEVITTNEGACSFKNYVYAFLRKQSMAAFRVVGILLVNRHLMYKRVAECNQCDLYVGEL